MRFLAVLPLAVIVFLTACNAEAPPAEVLRPVITQRVSPISAGSEASYVGEVHARHETQLSFRLAGKIVERAVSLGETVVPGQLLAQLDAHDARLAAESAQAAYQAAQERHNLAKSQFQRTDTLLARGLVSQAAFDQRRAELDVAAAQLQQARRQYALRQNQLAYTELRADHAGTITAVRAEPGQVVAGGQPVFGFVRSGEREVWVAVPENKIDALAMGEMARITFWALPDRQVQGRVREVAAAADPATRTYRIRITLLEPYPKVRLGMSATAHFQQGGSGQVIKLPLTSLYHDGEQAAVWVVNETTGALGLQPVTIVRYRDDAVILAAAKAGNGLQAGARVVTKGVAQLHVGQKVRPISPLAHKNGAD